MTRRRAFTAVETIIAIVLLVMLATALTGFLFDVQNTRERLSAMGEQRLAGALVIDALEESARFCVARAPDGPGVVGDRTSLRIASRRTTIDTAEPGVAALAGARTLALDWNESTGVLTLDGEPVTDRVRRMVLRYHDDETWNDRFDSAQARRLPAAIEIALWFGEPERATDGAPSAAAGAPTPELGEGFGLPTPAELDGLSVDGPVVWGEPDRYRVIAIPRLRKDDTP